MEEIQNGTESAAVPLRALRSFGNIFNVSLSRSKRLVAGSRVSAFEFRISFGFRPSGF
jgi:hypothetical protein